MKLPQLRKFLKKETSKEPLTKERTITKSRDTFQKVSFIFLLIILLVLNVLGILSALFDKKYFLIVLLLGVLVLLFTLTVYITGKLPYKTQKTIWATLFILPWLFGFGVLFLFPLVESLRYSFYQLTPMPGEIVQKYIGFENYNYAFNKHVTTVSSFKVVLINTTVDALINLPVLIVFSLFIAVMLNMKFRGRAIVRAIFFIPVILNSAAVTTALGGGDSMASLFVEQNIDKLFDLEYYLLETGMAEFLITFIVGLIDRIYSILSLSGVPILLFLASIQSVPNHLYEAAKIEGATSYETFWLITLPNVTPHIVTVTVYALVDTFLTSPVSTIISDELNTQKWGLSSAMSWIYVSTILGILLILAVFAKKFKIGGSHYE